MPAEPYVPSKIKRFSVFISRINSSVLSRVLSCLKFTVLYAAVMESVDIVDLKFTGRNTVRVRVPSAAPPSGQALLALILFYNAACQRWIDDCPGKPSIGVLSGTVNMLSIASPTKVLEAVSKCA